jgi:hypothetical protein
VLCDGVVVVVCEGVVALPVTLGVPGVTEGVPWVVVGLPLVAAPPGAVPVVAPAAVPVCVPVVVPVLGVCAAATPKAVANTNPVSKLLRMRPPRFLD